MRVLFSTPYCTKTLRELQGPRTARHTDQTICPMRISPPWTWLLAGLLAFVPAHPVAAAAGDAASLLALHRAYVGWQLGDGSVTSLLLRRTYTNADGKVTGTSIERRVGLAYRRNYVTKLDQHASSGFTGRIFWTTSDNGFTVPLIGNDAKFELAVDALFMEATTQIPAALHGTAQIDGKTVPVLQLTMQSGEVIDVDEDPETGAYLRAVIDPGGAEEKQITIASYMTIAPGKRFIGTWSFGDGKGSYHYTKAELNVPVADDQLHPPPPTATWTFANSAPFPIRVTDSRIYVDAKVNGVSGRFILDTGDSGITLTDDFANRAHVKTIDRSQALGIGGLTKDLVRRADTIEIGGNTLSNVIVTTINEHFNDELNEEKPVGLLGFDVFAASVVNLSLSGGTMQILDPSQGPATPPPGAVPFTVDLAAFVPRLPVKVDDKLDVLAVLDTGGSNLVLLSNQIESHGVNLVANRSGFLGANAMAGGIGGAELLVCGPLERLSVGPFIYSGTEACESTQWSLHSGLVGYDFLKHFDFVFDYPHDTLYMKEH